MVWKRNKLQYFALDTIKKKYKIQDFGPKYNLKKKVNRIHKLI